MKGHSKCARPLAVWLALALAACSGSTQPPTPPSANGSASGAGIFRPQSLSYYGCPVFTGGSYNATVTNSPVDKNSKAYIKSVIQAGDTAGFYASTGVEQVNLANDKTPLLHVHQRVRYHKFPVPYPWLSNFYIEPLGDAHAMIVHTQDCHLFESYGTIYKHPTLSAYSGAHWDLRKRLRWLPPGTPSAMASGLPLFAGMVRWEDYESGSINHALNWTGIAGSVAQYEFVRPASDTDWLPFQGKSSYQLPYGARLRLKASFNTSGWGTQATMVAQAMKTYGIYLSDTGSSGNGLYFANDSHGNNPWNSADLSSLSQITMSDFDVIQLPTILRVPGH